MQDPVVRDKCFAARDAYFKCWPANPSAECTVLEQSFSSSCPGQWRDFFLKQHVEDSKQQRMNRMDRIPVLTEANLKNTCFHQGRGLLASHD